ncbi:MAG TPA: tryptophan halogenase family protein [Rhizomicrobium sp.]|nr:tryptophan halogenase family protein [Rhizomicrobium sp.]
MLDSIVIVGGGTAGWLTAALLAKRLGADKPNGVKITLIESTDIGTIGVGEGTFPTFRRTLRTIGVGEAEFMRECSASFKQAIRFVDWEHAPINGRHTQYYHPFNVPHLMSMATDMAPYWALGSAGNVPFSDATTLQDKVVDALKAPKRIDDAPYDGPMNYAYHLDAAKLAAFLKNAGVKLGVRHLIGNVEKVELDEQGAISELVTKEHGSLKAGLYIDCTGFAGILIGRALGEPWRDVTHMLFVDRAVAMQVPYDREDAPIVPATVSSAHETGWTWDIGLDTRRGIGYCYSSKHTDDDGAEEVLRRYIGKASEGRNARRLKMRVGYRDRQWVKNCVAIGLSAGFLEPLESTGIIQIEAAAHMIAEYFPRAGDMERVAAHFSKIMAKRFELAVDFLKLHYYLSKRTDNAFWIDNTRPETASDALKDKLELWKRRPPTSLDFDTTYEAFKYQSYQYILFGMGFRSDMRGNESAYPFTEEAHKEFRRVQAASHQAVKALPDHRALLDQVYTPGFRPKKAHAGPTIAAREEAIPTTELMHR